jgi:diphosphate--fructose-6-phosphate 1-phosphotransferase
VVIGATHSLTDAMYLSDYLLSVNSKTKIIAVPCTVDGNVGHQMIEANVGFDTSSKTYGQLMGNILIDCASAFKYWYFIRIMGRDPSHLALECALRCAPNLVLISEEIRDQGKSLEQVVRDIADVVCERSAKGRNFGTVLIPEGLLISLPKIKPFYEELQELVDDSCGNDKAKKNEFVLKLQRDKEFRQEKMSPWSYALFNTLPEFTQEQIL